MTKKRYKKTGGGTVYLQFHGDESKFASFEDQFMQLMSVADIEEAFEEGFDCLTKKEIKSKKKKKFLANGDPDGEEPITKEDKKAFKANEQAAMSLTLSFKEKYQTCMRQACCEKKLARDMWGAVKTRIIPEDTDCYLSELLEKFRNCKPESSLKIDAYKEKLIELNDSIGDVEISLYSTRVAAAAAAADAV